MRILRTVLLTVAGGVLIAVVLFVVTAPAFFDCCYRVYMPGQNPVYTPDSVDPWTGEVRLETTTITNLTTGERVTTVRPLPPGDDHFVIPLPFGFAVGSLLTLTVITIVSRRPRTRPAEGAVPA
jgi:hypothetical protein